ncbi:natriuretic peptides A [Betta splendens]|uniref:Natriuretic peptides A n=1 Tax=Betta splendens TaxID=158456 RepID=A0A6P7MWJ6_BETSP|nr:natriuretic peptides A [Betta splendens]
MRRVVLWSLVVLLCQRTLVGSHVLGRASTTGDLAQLKSLLERFEETLADAGRDDSEGDYEGTDQESVRSRDWTQAQEGDPEPLVAEQAEAPAEGHSRAAGQRSRLQELLLATRKRASSCFGSRMDRIGNASGLGCNKG